MAPKLQLFKQLAMKPIPRFTACSRQNGLDENPNKRYLFLAA